MSNPTCDVCGLGPEECGRVSSWGVNGYPCTGAPVLRARLAAAERERDEARTELGTVVVACRLRPDESLAREPTTESLISVRELLRERDALHSMHGDETTWRRGAERERDAAVGHLRTLVDAHDEVSGACMPGERRTLDALEKRAAAYEAAAAWLAERDRGK